MYEVRLLRVCLFEVRGEDLVKVWGERLKSFCVTQSGGGVPREATIAVIELAAGAVDCQIDGESALVR